jgi:DNA-binding response OmpR family regulator
MFPFRKKKPRVLLLEDDISMQRLVSTLLRREGFQVDVVSNGNAAIESLERNEYVTLLLDLMMPIEGGMTVIQRLRKTKPDLLKRVILLTASPESVLTKVRTEVHGIVNKPFQPEQLIAAVRGLTKS